MNTSFDLNHIWHPFTQMEHHHAGTFPLIPITKAKGGYLYDEKGQAILDGISSWWTCSIGHCHSKVVQAIQQQAQTLDHVMFSGFTHEPAIRLAQKILELTPKKLNKVFFSDDGSTAVECALKMATQYWHNSGQPQRKKFLTLERAYHGDTVGAMSLGATSEFHHVFQHLRFPTLSLPISFNESNFLEEFEHIIQQHHHELIGIFLEPLVLGAGGMQMYSAHVLSEMVRITHAHDLLVMFYEVMTGFGRTGKMFALDHLSNDAPDILCLSKGISGGALPLGLTVISEHIEHAFRDSGFNHTKTFFHGHSYTANPICCAAAEAALCVLVEEKLIPHLNALEPIFQKWLKHFQTSPLPLRSPRFLGDIFALDVTPNPRISEPFSYAIFKKALQRHALIRPIGHMVYLMPPLCICAQELDTLFSVLDECLQEYFMSS